MSTDTIGHVNARLVAEYPSENRTELLAEHQKAAHELAELLRSLSEEQWSGHHHSEQIRDLATRASSPGSMARRASRVGRIACQVVRA